MRERSTEHARAVLSAEGFVVEDIPEEPPAERADLRLWAGQEEYILEAKLREPHAGWLELVKQAAAAGYASMSRPIDPWNSLSSVITKAHDQLVATPAGPGAFRVLWVAALHDDDDFVVACLEKRLLGSATVVPIDAEALMAGKSTITPKVCYHYESNDFERCTGIDAAVLGTRAGANLFVNYFSERRAQFREGRLHRMFDAHGAVVDPEIQTSIGDAYVLGRDFVGPRGNNAQWRYLKDRYGVATTAMHEHQFAGLVSVPISALRKPPAG